MLGPSSEVGFELSRCQLEGFTETIQVRFAQYGFDCRGGEIVKCCGWRGADPDGLSGGFNVSVLKFDALDDKFNEFVSV